MWARLAYASAFQKSPGLTLLCSFMQLSVCVCASTFDEHKLPTVGVDFAIKVVTIKVICTLGLCVQMLRDSTAYVNRG